LYLRSTFLCLITRFFDIVLIFFFILLISFDSLYILDSIVVLLIIHRITLSYVGFICYIVVTILPLLLIYITYLGHFRLSVYMWGIFLVYVHHRLSSRLRSYVFWEAGHDRNGQEDSYL